MASTANGNIINTSIASTATQSSSIHSPGRRGSRLMPSSPWTTIVRGESDAIAATATAVAMANASSPVAPSTTAAASTAATAEPVVLVASPSSTSMVADYESSDNGNGSNGSNAGKRPAWNKPSNGVVEVGPVMGAVSWPALSESTRTSGKPSQDSTKGSSDGLSTIPVPQGTGSATTSSLKQDSHNANPNLTPNHTMPARQRSFKRNAGNSTSNGGTSQPTGSQNQTGDMHSNNSSPRDHAQRNSLSRNANDHPQQQQQQQRNSFRRNGGPHSRDGSHHHNYGRRDQDRTNQDWNGHRNFNGRDAHMQPQRVSPRFLRHPPPPPPLPTAPFIGPSPVRAFGNLIGFHELPPPMYYVAGPPPDPLRVVPFLAPMPHAVYLPAPDIQLHSKIVNQIEYYFSNENLIKDTFLRQNMDDQGFVPVKLIAGFNKVSHLTDNIQLILDAIRRSTVVEVQTDLLLPKKRKKERQAVINALRIGEKVRRRNDWIRWMMPPSVQFPHVTGAPSVVRQSHDMLVSGVQSFSLEENSKLQSGGVHNVANLGKASSGDSSSQSQVSSAEGAGHVGVQGISDSSTSARNSS